MRRTRALFSLAVLILSLSSMPTLGLSALEGNVPTPPQAKVRPGHLVVEVLEITDGSPVPGLRVELVQTGESRFTDQNGRVVFDVRPGGYDVRVYGLTGPGPASRTDEEHATVGPGRTVVVQVLDCGVCV